MANIRLNQNSHVDYFGNLYFEKFGVRDVEFTPRVVKVDDAKVVLLHIYGVNTNNGAKVDVDLWPRQNCTEEFINALPEKFEDVIFRVGYHVEKDIVTGEERTIEGQPKFLCYIKKGKEIYFDGDVHQYGDSWNNDAKSEKEESEE